ncbi:MAG: hypothetical protein WAT79_06480 [Saprospiraceae bacterium]
MKFCTSLFFIVWISCISVAQPFSPNYRVNVTYNQEQQTISGTCLITMESSFSEMKLQLSANAFRSKTTIFAKNLLEYYSNEFYFYNNETELGGYTSVNITANGQKIPLDFTQEYVDLELPANGFQEHKIVIDYVLKLPKNIAGLGFDEYGISLQDWYPTIAYHDGKSWFTPDFTFQIVKPESIGRHDISINLPSDFIALYQKKWLVETQVNTFHLSTEGKSPDLRLAPLSKISTLVLQEGSDTIVTFLYKDTLSHQKLDHLGKHFLQVHRFWNKHFPFTSTNRYIFYPEQAKKKHYDIYLLDGLLHQMWQQHFLSQDSLGLFTDALSLFYTLQYQRDEQRNISSKVVEDLDLHLCSQAILIYQNNGKPNLSFDSIDQFRYSPCFIQGLYYSLLHSLSQAIGNEAFLAELDDYLKLQHNKEISFEGLVHHVSKITGRDFIPLLLSYQNQKYIPAYSLQHSTIVGDSIFLDIQNKSDLKVPFPIVVSGKNKPQIKWYDGHTGLKTVSLSSPTEDIKKYSIQLKSRHYVPLNNSKTTTLSINNLVYPPIITQKKVSLFKQRQSINPMAGYTYSDKFFLGIHAKSKFEDNPKGFYYNIMPMYSFRAKSFVGDAKVGYVLVPSKGPDKINLNLFVKSYDKFFQKTLDYRERYFKLEPQIEIVFYPRYSIKKASLLFRPIFLWEEEGNFDMNGKYTGNNYKPLTILHVNYQYFKSAMLGDLKSNLSIEYQKYPSIFSTKSSSYIKTTFVVDKSFYYQSNKKIDLRFFGAVFLKNTERNSSSFDPTFVRGSIALLHQGFNDYLYDDYYLTRENQNLWVGNQISYEEGGGLKHAFGSAYSLGMSNNFATSINITADIPIKKLDVLKVFFDGGLYVESDQQKKYLYSSGLSLHFGDYVKVFYPFIMSKELNVLYGNDRWTWNKLTFAINFKKIRKEL